MYKTLKVLLVLALVTSAIQAVCLVVDVLEPQVLAAGTANSEWQATHEIRAALRWKIYWFGGLAMAAAGFVMRPRRELAGIALAIAGVYMMLLGNNAGFIGSGLAESRLATSLVTFAGLVLAMGRVSWRQSDEHAS